MIDSTESYAIGIDLGATKIYLALIDRSGNILCRLRLDTAVKEGPEAVIEQIVRGIVLLQEQANRHPIRGIGIGVAGQVDPETGVVLFGPNLDWHCVSLKSEIGKSFDLPVTVLNDVRAITYAELLYGAGKGLQNFVCLFIGTGIGGGIVTEGRLLQGCSGSAGEIGHLVVDFNGPLCACGNKGCLEAYAGGWGIAERARELYAERSEFSHSIVFESDGKVRSEVSAKTICEAFLKGDSLAKVLIDQAKRALVAGCSGLVNVLNPCRLVLGGRLIDGIPKLLEEIEIGIRSASLGAAGRQLTVVKSQSGQDAGVLGAAAHVFLES